MNIFKRGKIYWCKFEIDKKLYQSIQKHLKLANIEIDIDKNLQHTSDNLFIIKTINEDTYYEDMIASISNIIRSNELNKLIDKTEIIIRRIKIVNKYKRGNFFTDFLISLGNIPSTSFSALRSKECLDTRFTFSLHFA